MKNKLALDDSEISRVCVIGGSGFVGRYAVPMLSSQRYQVTVPVRHRERAKHLILLPTVDVVEANVNDEQQLGQLVRGHDAVINFAGVLHDGSGDRSFRQSHIELPRKLIAACRDNGVQRLIHFSALGAAPEARSEYLKSKAEGEALVRASDVNWTIFRPSVIFGRGDSFLNRFAMLLKSIPLMLLASPDARFQPVFVEDVAAALTHSLTDITTYGQSYDLCGPKVYTLRELLALVGEITGHRRPIIGLGDQLSYLQALLLEYLPGKLMTRDNYYSMKHDNVGAASAAFPFGIMPLALEAVVPTYLGNETPRGRYRFYRDHAGRSSVR